MDALTFPSGVFIADPWSRLCAFLGVEYAWYDAIADDEPNRVTPTDVLIAGGINAYVGGASVSRLRLIHEGLDEASRSRLPTIPIDLALRDVDVVDPIVELLVEAAKTKWALSAVASKVFHRKRRHLIPILDSVMVKTYCSEREASVLASKGGDKVVGEALFAALLAIQEDLRERSAALDTLAQRAAEAGWAVTPLRIHDILVWSETEPAGYYRS